MTALPPGGRTEPWRFSDLDDVEVVLDDDDRVAGIDQPVPHVEQALDVGKVQAGGRLVEDVDGAPGCDAAELPGQTGCWRAA